MVYVEDKYRDCLRFLWVSNVDDDDTELVAFRFTRVVSGVNSRTLLLNATINHHMKSTSNWTLHLWRSSFPQSIWMRSAME